MTREEELRVAAESGCDVRTIRKYERGDSVTGASAERIRKAIDKLKIKGGDASPKKRKS